MHTYYHAHNLAVSEPIYMSVSVPHARMMALIMHSDLGLLWSMACLKIITTQ